MYLDGQEEGASKKITVEQDGSDGSRASTKDFGTETVIYGNAADGLQISGNNMGFTLPMAGEWQPPPSYNGGALMSLEDIGRSYDRNVDQATYYGVPQHLPSLPWQSSIAFNENNDASGMMDHNGHNGNHDSSTTMQSAYTAYNNSNDISNVYGCNNMILDRAITVSDLFKLTDAVNELTKRMPLPPTQELLKSIDPHLAMKLQLTYLHAYMQNQQLLIDIKNRILGGVISGCDLKSAMRPAIPTLVAPPPTESSNMQAPYHSSNIEPISYDVMPNASWNNTGVGGQQIGSQIQPYAIGPSIKESPPLDTSIGSNDCQDINGDRLLVSYPSFDDAVDALNPPKPRSTPRKYEITPVVSSDVEMVTTLGETSNTQLPALPALPSSKEIMNAIPPEIRNMVKYDGQKHSFVSVYLGPLGARRRRLFSIRKFGILGALKLATDFAVGSTSAAVATKERRLLEEVCEVALKSNPRSGEKLLYIDAARALPETRGLVFSCGAQLWMIIVYDATTGDRIIETFSVEEYGFEEAYKAAVAALDAKLQNSDVMTSKLSGPLYFWLEARDGDVDLCLMVTPRDLLRQGPSEQDLYIGRFNVLRSGGFNSARKLAQKWRSDLRSQLIN